MNTSAAALLEQLTPLMRDAGQVIMDIYATDFDVTKKGDESPVTQADQKAETVILAGLAKIAPGIPVVAEEAVSAGNIPDVSDRFFLVDPLDGTKEFISRNGEFTVNIALVEHGKPVLGLPFYPVSAFLAYKLFAKPVLERRMGLAVSQFPTERAHLAVAIRSPSSLARTKRTSN